MEQRQVGLGDVLDDYCTRERRVTNHAVVAIVGTEIKLTRCTTCDTEHPYKAARVPPRRQTRLVATVASPRAAAGAGPALQGSGRIELEPPPPAAAPPPAPALIDSVRRPLIRATLTRPEGVPGPTRQAPVFTIREHAGREGNVDHGGRQARKRRNGTRPGSEPNGNRIEDHSGPPTRFGQDKTGSQPGRSRGPANRPERAGNGQSRNRGKGRSR